MAEFLNKIPTNLTEYPNSFKRQGAFPLEAYSVFYTKAEADTYAASNPLAYVGQTIAVALSNAVTLYVIDQNSKLKEVGSVPVGDGQSIEVVDGKIQVKGFTKGYYKYNAEADTRYEYIGGEFISGLEPRVIAVANGKYEIAWYEPNPTTVEGLESQISSLSGTVGGLNSRVSEAEELLADHDTRIIHLEGNGKDVLGAVKTIDFDDTTDTLVFKDTKGNTIKSINLNIAAVTKSIEYMATVTIEGTVYTNVLVLTDANDNKTVVELDDLLNIYTTEQNATDVQLTVTSTDGGENADTNVISAKLTDSVKEAINKGVAAHDALFDGTTTFVLNGGNASGYTVATDENTEV